MQNSFAHEENIHVVLKICTERKYDKLISLIKIIFYIENINGRAPDIF